MHRSAWSFCAAAFVVASAIGGGATGPMGVLVWLPVVALLALGVGLRGAPVRTMALVVAGWVAGMLHAGWDARCEHRRTPVSERIGERQIRRVVRGVVTRGPRWLRSGWIFELRVEAFDGERLGDASSGVACEANSAGRIRVFLPGKPLQEPGTPLPRPGDRVETFLSLERYPGRRFPSRAGWRRRMRQRGVVARAVVEDDVEVVGAERHWRATIRRKLADWRTRYVRTLLEHLPAERAGYALALTAGERGLLAAEQTRPFWTTETGHLLAISGLHLGILASMIWWLIGLLVARWTGLLRRVGFRRATGTVVLLLLGAYVLFVGAPVSACRAFLMTGGVVVASLVRRPVSPMRALALAGAVLVAAEPDAARRLGFQLSFAATAGILLVVGHPPRWLAPDPVGDRSTLERWGAGIGLGVAASVGATLATWPVLLAWHGWITPHAVWLNVVVTPVVGTLVVPVAAVGAALTAVNELFGSWVAGLAGEAMARAGDALGAFDFLADPVVTGLLPPWSALLFGMGVACLLASRGRWKPVAVGIAVAVVAVVVGRPGSAAERLRVHFIPVGQGDATLVEWPGGETMLVDAGGSRLGDDPGRTVVVPYLRRLGIDRLDWVVATHGDVDHVGGLAAVAEEMEPRHFVAPALPGVPRLQDVRRRMRRAGAELVRPDELDGHRLDRSRVGCSVPGGSRAAENDRSVVCRLDYGGRRVLLAGDIERRAEARMLERHRLDADLLKVPHHGSKTSSSPAWLDRVDPGVAVASAGRFNPFGHPAESVVRRYRRRGVDWFETSRRGLVVATIGADGSMVVRVANPERR